MPVIPSYKRRVGEADAPSVRLQTNATPDMFGAGIGKALGQVADVTADISLKMDKADLVQAESLLRQKSTEFLYNDIFKRQGTAARDSDKAFGDKFKEFSAEARAKLSGRAAGIFDQIATQYQTSLYPKLQEHMTKQAEVALNDAYSSGLYTDAIALSQDGYFRNKNGVAQMMAAGDTSVAALYQGRDPAFIKAKQIERSNAVLGAALKTLHDKGDYAGADEFIQMWGGKMDPRTLAPFQGWVKNKQEDNEIVTLADQIHQRFGDKAEAAIEYIRGLGGAEKPVANAASYFQGNIDGVNSPLVNRLAKLAVDKGIKIVVNSGKRSREEQAALYEKYLRGEGNLAAKPGTSRHEFGDAIDTDSLDGISNEELAKYGLARTVDGESWHIEAIGGGRGMDPVKQSKLEKEYLARVSRAATIEAKEEKRKLETLYNNMVGVTDPVQQVELWKNSGLKPYQIAAGIEAVTKKVNSELEKEVIYQLESKDLNGTLSQADLQAALPKLSQENQIKYLQKYNKDRAGETDKAGKAADERLKHELDLTFTATRDKEQKQASLLYVRDQLDREGVKGAARFARGMEILRENRVVVDGKGKADAAKAYIKIGAANNEERSRLVRDFGQEVVDLAAKGHANLGKEPQFYWQINQFLSSIGQQIESGDTAAQVALNEIIRRGIALNAESFNLFYEAAKRGRKS